MFFFSSRRRHTRLQGDWSSDVCSSDLCAGGEANTRLTAFITLTDATQATNRSSTLTLAQNSKARGVGIQVLRNNVPVSFGPDSGSLGNANQWNAGRSEEHTSELQSPCNLVC